MDTMNPRVTRIEGDLINQTIIDLGSPGASAVITDRVRWLSAGKETYLIEWTGGRVPRGAIVNGKEIDWTQHGIVYSNGKQIGYYERIIDDLRQPTQAMLVFC